MTLTITDQFADQRDLDLATERMKTYDAIEGARVGDFVVFADGEERRFVHDWGTHLQTYTGGSFHLSDSSISCSGSMDPGVPRELLTDTGETKPGSVWIFHHGIPKAHAAVTFHPDFRVFKCSMNRKDAEQLAYEQIETRRVVAAAEQAKAVAARQPVTPDQLAEAFCGEKFRDLRGAATSWVERTDDECGVTFQVARGHCGYNGRRGTDDALLTGFDDGYEFGGWLSEGRGWVQMADKGSWPYVMYLVYRAGARAASGEKVWAIANYVEGDFTVWKFASKADLEKFWKTIPEAD